MPAQQPETSGLSFHALSSDQTLKALSSSDSGLKVAEATRRLDRYGSNTIKEFEQISVFKIALSQFQNFLVYLLLGAATLSFVVGELIDVAAILIIIILNGTLGFIQEYKAEKALEALKKLQTLEARVERDGTITTVPAEELVPGDVIHLAEGDKVPADARLLHAVSLQTDESTLTGESRPVSKVTTEVAPEASLSDRINLVYSGTGVVRGKGVAVVFATGMQTEFGQIANLVQTSTNVKTPLQRTLDQLGKLLGLLSIAIALPGFGLGLLVGQPFVEMLLLTISLMVSAIPEGLPIVVTITLALGAQRMVKHRTLVRKLPAVEALGSVDVICTDKTGTSTENKMTVVEIAASGQRHSIQSKPTTSPDKTQRELITCALLCNDATATTGDPTERALFQLGSMFSLAENELASWTRVDEIPFNSDHKYMVTLHAKTKKTSKTATYKAFMKGAPEKVLAMSSHVLEDGKKYKLTKKRQQAIETQLEHMSADGLRVLAFATKHIPSSKKNSEPKLASNPTEYTFLGLAGLLDPARAEVAESLTTCRQAGIRVIMITGDHPLTAQAIATQVGLDTSVVMTGVELEQLDRAEVEAAVETCSVFARVSPLHKLQLLRVLQAQGHLVAMTGDGVNDAPALKEAHIGIAVGSGTDLAKEVSDLIILDDNFATITQAVYLGRGIFSNIKKFIALLISTNFDEIMVLFASLVLGTPLPLLPIHLLWLNVMTDSIPAMALAVDKFDPEIMNQPPQKPDRQILRGVLRFAAVVALLAFLSSFGVFLYFFYGQAVELRYAQSVVFTVTVIFELFIVFSVRSDRSAFKPGLFSNKWLLAGVTASLVLQLIALYTPFTREIFKTAPILLADWPLLLAAGFSGFLIIEIVRAIKYQAWPMVAAKLASGSPSQSPDSK